MAVNETINATLNSSGNIAHVIVDGVKDGFLPTLGNRITELVTAPAQNPDMMWIVTPLVIMTLLMQFYFSRYHHEELGWNTAVGNSMVLIFVSLDLLRFVYGDTGNITIQNLALYNFKATVIALVIAAGGFLLMFSNFFHVLPKKFSFFLSSSIPINMAAYVAIVLVYTQIPLDFYTLIGAIVLFVLLMIIFNILDKLSPTADEEKPIKELPLN